ncbi:MAG: hypothetical protein ABI378_06920 [Chitinophagaceae bacterium]
MITTFDLILELKRKISLAIAAEYFAFAAGVKARENELISSLSQDILTCKRRDITISLFVGAAYLSPKETIPIVDEDAFTFFIKTFGMPDFILFDDDENDSIHLRRRAGYDCAKFLVMYCVENDLEMPYYEVCQSSGLSRDDIERLLKNFISRWH